MSEPTNSLVARLRNHCYASTAREAADEIERLTRELGDYAIGHVNQCGEISVLQIENERLTRLQKQEADVYRRSVEEIERLRAALEKIADPVKSGWRTEFHVWNLVMFARETLAHEMAGIQT